MDDQNLYKQKIKGFNLAFSIREKYERIPEDDPGHRYKVKNKKVAFAEVKKLVKQIREKREKAKQDKMMEANEQYMKKMRYIQKVHDQLRQVKLKKIIELRQKHEGSVPNRGSGMSYESTKEQLANRDLLKANQSPFSYLAIKNQKSSVPVPQERNLKVTLDIITKMHYQDFNTVGDKKQAFNPMNLIEQSKLNTYSDEEEEAGGDQSLLALLNGDDDEPVDDYVQKKLPRMEDFIDKEALKKQLRKKKKQSSKKTNEHSEKMMTLKSKG